LSINRRDLLKLISAVIAGSFIGERKPTDAQAAPTTAPLSTREYQGPDLSGWEIALGDALYARDGEPPVTLDDIETVHESGYSELRANIQRRIIMAHNITFKRFVDDEAFQFIHTCTYKFRLPYLPLPDISADLNAQTLEGGIFVWDGSETRLDYGIAFQWGLNPWSEFGDMKTWTDTNGGEWVAVGHLTPDTEWHEVRMVVDFRREATALLIDGEHYLTHFTRTPKPETWGTETAARLQAEIVSIYPEPSGIRAMHKAEFKDWTWAWERIYQVFLPLVSK